MNVPICSVSVCLSLDHQRLVEKKILARCDPRFLSVSSLIFKQECVICGLVYVTEVDWAGRERLVLEDSGKNIATPVNKGKAREVSSAVICFRYLPDSWARTHNPLHFMRKQAVPRRRR